MSAAALSTTIMIQRCLGRLGRHDPEARAELLGHARRRLMLLAERMFARFPMLHQHEEVEDVIQEAMVRLWKSLEAVGPSTMAGFMGLVALQIRRALRDLARNHFGRDHSAHGFGNHRPAVNGNNGHTFENAPADSASNPEALACWAEFHEAADRLPEPERTAFDLLYYHELPQAEAAVVMQVSERQVRRYWQSARLKLHRLMEGCWPEL